MAGLTFKASYVIYRLTWHGDIDEDSVMGSCETHLVDVIDAAMDRLGVTDLVVDVARVPDTLRCGHPEH
jgi:hypothetical protein